MLCERPARHDSLGARDRQTIAGANLEDFKIGDVIRDKYEVTRILGKGGMGIVLEALHRELGVHVAIKFPRPGLRDEPAAVARFKQEARAGMSIKNAHVAQVYDVDTVDGSPFIVMEHLKGRDLAAMLEERGPLAPRGDRRPLAPGLRGRERGACPRHHPSRSQAQ